MDYIRKNKILTAVVAIILSLIALSVLAIVNYSRLLVVDTYDECVASGGVIPETFPAQCVYNGKTYVQTLSDEENSLTSFPVEYFGTSSSGACNINSDCVVSGCNSEICQSATEDIAVSTCDIPNKPTPSDVGYTCKCTQQQCLWSQ